MRRLWSFLRHVSIVAAWLLVAPTGAFAQASITGVVKDSSAAVLPGVTVEAASPALIEKVRSAVTDGTGQFRIVDLRPGTYSVTFSLPGFSNVRREGVELTGSSTVAVNADMRVGAVAETITVTGEAPIVDVQSATRQQVLSGESVREIPTARTYNALVVLVPAITGGQTDVAQGPCTSCTFAIHGGRTSEGKVMVDGISVAVPQAGSTNYFTDSGSAEETQITTSGGLGEVETGGPVINVVPRTGGNTYRGTFFTSGANSAMQGDNITQELRDQGLTAPGSLIKAWDVTGTYGGPIKRDRLWFYGTGRTQGNYVYNVNLYHNKNAGNPAAWNYEPDLNQRAIWDRTWENATMRLTTQITPRNKINIFWDEQWANRNSKDGLNNSSTTSPEARQRGEHYPVRVQQVTYSSPATSRLLIDVGFGTYLQDWGWREKPGAPTHDLVRINEQCAAGCPANGSIPNLTFRSTNWARNFNTTITWRASTSYVTGAHNLKVGYQGGHYGVDTNNYTNSTNLAYRVNNGVPNQLTMVGYGVPNYSRTRYLSLYGQEQWTSGRLTLQSAVRFDKAWSYADPQQVGPVKFIPTAISFPKTSMVDSFKDITPRLGASYDLFGNGKTALRVNVSKYLEASIVGGIYSQPNPVSTIITSTTRTWTDGNRNWTPDCDLMNPATQDFRTAGGDFCGVWGSANFGSAAPSTFFDPAVLSGWGVRPSDWNIGASVQHEVLPRTSVEVGYYRRWFQNFRVTDNRATAPADFTPFSLVAPLDPRLPNGGGYTIDGLYNVVPGRFGLTDNYVTSSEKFGEQYHRYQGIDLNVTARVRGGLTFQGGTSTGQTVDDNCEIRAVLPETGPLNPYCHVTSGFQTQVRALGSYTIPKVDVQVSGTFRSNPGIALGVTGVPSTLAANYVASNAEVAPSLGRNLSGNLTSVTVNLIPTGSQLSDRVNNTDLRIAKVLRFGRTRTNVGLDLYNAFNRSPVLAYNQSFIPNGAWLVPDQVLSARLLRLSAQFEF